jgi:hypothetical protein
MKHIKIILKNPTRSSQKAHSYFTAEQGGVLFREMMSVHCENHMKHINTQCKQILNVKAGGTNTYTVTL